MIDQIGEVRVKREGIPPAQSKEEKMALTLIVMQLSSGGKENKSKGKEKNEPLLKANSSVPEKVQDTSRGKLQHASNR